MIQKRNIGLAILYSILTCGLYTIYWFIRLTDEANYLSGEQAPSGGMAFLFTILTCGIYTFFWNYNMGKRIFQAQQSNGGMAQDNSILYLILSLFGLGIIAYCIMQSDINNMVQDGYAK